MNRYYCDGYFVEWFAKMKRAEAEEFGKDVQEEWPFEIILYSDHLAELARMKPYCEHRPDCAKCIGYQETNISGKRSHVHMTYDDNQPCTCGLAAIFG